MNFTVDSDYSFTLNFFYNKFNIKSFQSFHHCNLTRTLSILLREQNRELDLDLPWKKLKKVEASKKNGSKGEKRESEGGCAKRIDDGDEDNLMPLSVSQLEGIKWVTSLDVLMIFSLFRILVASSWFRYAGNRRIETG